MKRKYTCWASPGGVLLEYGWFNATPNYFMLLSVPDRWCLFWKQISCATNLLLRVIEERGDTKKVEQLKKQGPPPYYGSNVAMQEAAFLMETFNYMNADPNIDDDGFNTFQDLAGSEYGLNDKLNWFLGALETMNVVYPQLWEVDFRKQAAQLDVPVYFLIGRHDVNAPPVLTEDYYNQLSAPIKKMIWFKRSGHNPWVTESDEFVDTVVNTVLTETYSDG